MILAMSFGLQVKGRNAGFLLRAFAFTDGHELIYFHVL